MKSFYKNNIDNDLINKLKSLEISPPNDLWNDIESTLKSNTRKRIIIITSWASAATLALLISIGGYFHLQTKNQNITSNKIINPSSNLKEIPSNENIKYKKVLQNEVKKVNVILDGKIKARQSENSDSISSLGIIKPDEKKQELLQEISIKKFVISFVYGTKPEKISIKNQRFNSLAVAETKKQKGNLYLSVSGFPIYSFHSAGFTKKAGTERESGLSSYGGSISIRYEFANRISIESGVSLGFMGQKESDLYLVNSINRNSGINQQNNLSNSFGTLITSNTDYTLMHDPMLNSLSIAAVNENEFNKIEAYQRFRYLEIPLTVAKGFKFNKINLFLKGGVSAGILINNMLDLKGDNIHLKGKTQGVDKFSTTAIASIGIAVPIYNKLNLLIEPSFKYGLKALQSGETKTHPFSSYVKCGVEIQI